MVIIVDAHQLLIEHYKRFIINLSAHIGVQFFAPKDLKIALDMHNENKYSSKGL